MSVIFYISRGANRPFNRELRHQITKSRGQYLSLFNTIPCSTSYCTYTDIGELHHPTTALVLEATTCCSIQTSLRRSSSISDKICNVSPCRRQLESLVPASRLREFENSGVVLDSSPNFDDHIKGMILACNFHILACVTYVNH